jgi:hypothetical protein
MRVVVSPYIFQCIQHGNLPRSCGSLRRLHVRFGPLLSLDNAYQLYRSIDCAILQVWALWHRKVV